MCQLGLIYFYFFNIYICAKRYHGMCKYQQVNFFSNVVKSIKPTYSNKEELATLNKFSSDYLVFMGYKWDKTVKVLLKGLCINYRGTVGCFALWPGQREIKLRNLWVLYLYMYISVTGAQ